MVLGGQERAKHRLCCVHFYKGFHKIKISKLLKFPFKAHIIFQLKQWHGFVPFHTSSFKDMNFPPMVNPLTGTGARVEELTNPKRQTSFA